MKTSKKTIGWLSLVIILSIGSTNGSANASTLEEGGNEYHVGERCSYPTVGRECVTWISTGDKCGVYYNCGA